MHRLAPCFERSNASPARCAACCRGWLDRREAQSACREVLDLELLLDDDGNAEEERPELWARVVREEGIGLLAEAGETARLHDQLPESRIVCGEAGLEAIEQSMDAPVAHLVVDIDGAATDEFKGCLSGQLAHRGRNEIRFTHSSASIVAQMRRSHSAASDTGMC
jgi:hypothetical protein